MTPSSASGFKSQLSKLSPVPKPVRPASLLMPLPSDQAPFLFQRTLPAVELFLMFG
jgi:hypothetical protein